MSLDLSNYQQKVMEAVQAFWGNREMARQKQIQAGRSDQGERAGVTAGKNMDGFLALAVDIVRDNGLHNADILFKKRLLTLPGFFRPTKQWDMLVLNEGKLVVALEFKSQVGPSFGNNFNNRAEEAIGTAHDLWTAYREGAFGQDAPRPFVGWVMLLEDAPGSRSPVESQSPNFPVFPEFIGASYADRTAFSAGSSFKSNSTRLLRSSYRLVRHARVGITLNPLTLWVSGHSSQAWRDIPQLKLQEPPDSTQRGTNGGLG